MSRLLPILAAGEPSFTPSLYSPSQIVEIAFTATYATPAADRVWTDVTDYVELHDRIDITVGRQDERSTADANDLTLTLDNSDGRFTALRSASPYYPNVKLGRPIRVSVTTVTGVAFIRFVGFIDQWPVEWDGTDAYAKATIRATSRLSRLGLTAELRSTVENEVLTDGPVAYWTMGDASASTQAMESSGNNLAPLQQVGAGAAVVFGEAIGPSADGLTAATFANAQYLATPTPVVLAATDLAVECWIVPDVGVGGDPCLRLTTNTGNQIRVAYNSSGLGSTAVFVNGASVMTTTGAGDGTLRHIAVEVDRSDDSLRLFVNGVLEDSAAATPVTGTASVTLEVGAAMLGSMAHVAMFDSLPGSSRWASHYGSGDGHAGDTTDERLVRVLAWAGVASTEVDAEAGSETMTYQLTSGMTVVDALRECESTEGGVLFDGPDGNVKFHNRSHRYQPATTVTLDMESQHVGADYAPRLDRSTLVNDMTVENPTTGENARATDADSVTEYGIATGSATSLTDSYDPLVQKAAWTLALYAEPRIRVPSLTVDVLAHVGLTPSAEDLLALTIGDVIAVTNAPTQSDTTSPSYFVEGYSETIGPESYEITFNLSPTAPYLNVLILDDPVRGKLDSGNLLAY